MKNVLISVIAIFNGFVIKKNLWMFFTCFLLMGSCIKHKTIEPDNPYGLPNATQEGKNNFACRVNGENWIGTNKRPNYFAVFYRDTSILISGIKSEEYLFEKIYFYRKGLTFNLNNEIPLNDTINNFAEFHTIGSDCFVSNGGYGTIKRKGYEGGLTITRADTIKKIVSGTFWFNILTDYCDTMKVTDGRFDIRYY